MAKQIVKLIDKERRDYALRLVGAAPENHVVTISEPTRTLDQSAKMWAMLTELSQQKPEGITATPDDWKNLAMNACGWECQFQMGLDGRPFPVGFRSSRLTVRQMSDLIEFLHEYGARHGVVFSEREYAA